jgi:hypothetical protein
LNFFNWIGPGKNKIGIAIKFCKCYIIKRSSSNFSNKTQLKNNFFLLDRTQFNALLWTDPVQLNFVESLRAKRPQVTTYLPSQTIVNKHRNFFYFLFWVAFTIWKRIQIWSSSSSLPHCFTDNQSHQTLLHSLHLFS